MLGIVHLTDIHFDATRPNPLCDRAPALAAAIASAVRGCSACILVVSGDIAQAGLEPEYVIAGTFFDAVNVALSTELGNDTPLTWVVTPGNHDCNHQHASQLRKAAIDRVSVGHNPDAQSIDLACTVLKDYRAFAKSRFPAGQSTSHELVTRFRVSCEDRAVTLYVVNAAWCSRHPETYGGVWLPEAAIKAMTPTDSDFSVCVTHFPVKWFDYDTQRLLRASLNAHCQLVLTGHEHSPDQYAISAGELFCEHLEGGALQDLKEPRQSEFHVLRIMMPSLETQLCRMRWDDASKRYNRVSPTPTHLTLLRRRGLAANPSLSHTREFDELLDDLGAPISHPDPHVKKLSDFFVWPDVSLDLKGDADSSRIVTSRTLPTTASGNLLIAGAERSGKTTLGKQLLRQRAERDRVCVWLDVEQCERSLRQSLDAALDFSVGFQFGSQSVELVRQIPREEACVIVDNLHCLPIDLNRERLLLDLKARFGSVILLANEDWASEQSASKDRLPELFSFQFARLLPFGPKLRHAITSKWVSRIPTLRHDPAAAERRVELYAVAIDGLVGRDLVPPFPSTLLIMLQTMDAQGADAINHGSLGHTYHTLIHSRVSQGVTTTQANMRMRYLTELAWALFESDGREWSDATLQKWHAGHMNHFDLGAEAATLPADLRACGILELKGGVWHFRHKYVYFYFVAEHVAGHLHDESIKTILAGLVLRLHSEDASSIFSFVAFNSRDPYVLDTLLSRAADMHREVAPCDVSCDCRHFDELARNIPNLVFEQEKRQAVRAAVLEESDGQDRCEAKAYAARDARVLDEEEQGFINGFTTAIRLITVIGQVVRNHAGSLEASRLRELVSAAYSLSMRTVSTFIGLTLKDPEGLVRDLVAALKERDAAVGIGELQSRVAQRVVFMMEVAAFGVLKHTANAVGMGEMLERTLEHVRSDMNNGTVELIDTAIQLDKSHTYPRERVLRLAEEIGDSAFALGILRIMCLTNFYLFRVPDADRNAVCDTLEIKADSRQVFSDRTKLPSNRVTAGSKFKLRKARRR